MRYEITDLHHFLFRALPLLKASELEVAGTADPLSIDESLYSLLEKAGNLICILAIDGETPVGCAAVLLSRDLHHDRIVACNDVLYVIPEYRHGLVPAKLMAMAEHESRSRGASSFTWAAPSGSTLESALAKRPDRYRKTETMFSKEL